MKKDVDWLRTESRSQRASDKTKTNDSFKNDSKVVVGRGDASKWNAKASLRTGDGRDRKACQPRESTTHGSE